MTRYCIMCGDEIPFRHSFGAGHTVSVCSEPECITKYLDMFEHRYKKIEFINRTGFCGRCGKPFRLDFKNKLYRHSTPQKCEEAPEVFDDSIKKVCGRKPGRRKGKEVRTLPMIRVPLKPWKDPQSLFCSPKLGEIIKKEIATGEECRGET